MDLKQINMESINYLLLLIVLNSHASQFDLDRIKVLEAHKNKGVSNFVTVGNDVSCDYQIGTDTLQDAVNSGEPEIRLAVNATYSGISIATDLILIGGYANCTDATNNILSTTKSEMNYPINPIGVHIITSSIQVIIKNLTIKGFANGISSTMNNVELSIYDSLIELNSALEGAGIYLNAVGNTFLENVIIQQNYASQRGGAIYCKDHSITIVGKSNIRINYSPTEAGGIYAENCNVLIVGGNNPAFGIMNNATNGNGGGIYLKSNSTLEITGGLRTINSITYGDLSTPYSIKNNYNQNTNSAAGGGIYSNHSTVILENIVLDNNSAVHNGGAISAQNFSNITLTRSSESCWSSQSCNVISNNTAGVVGGAFQFTSSSQGYIQATTFKNNRADTATVLNVGTAGGNVRIDTSYIYANGNFGVGGFNDTDVIRNNSSNFQLYHTTLVANKSVSNVIHMTDGTLELKNSIIYNAAMNVPFLTVDNGTTDNSCILADDTNNSTTGIVTAINASDFNTLFVDTANGDYHLSLNSIALDNCNTLNVSPALSKDTDNENFGFDDPNNLGINFNDSGADESYLGDIIFKNDFEVS